MADNIIQVNVTANKPKSVTVSSAQVGTEITASSDTGRFWAQTSKNWAVSDTIVDNTDYSSKYYANKAKESATNANNTFSSIRETYQDFQDESNNAFNELNVSKAEVLGEIDIAKTNAVDSINTTKTTIITDIEFVADGEKKEIEDLIDNGKEELKESIGDVKVLTTLEIGDIGIAPLGIDETKGKRRYLNGQLIIQDQYVEFNKKVKSAVALYPSLACTESEWQTTATMTVGGQVGKFVVDDEAGTIRLPKIIMPIQGLTDLSKLAEIVEAGLPSIEHKHTFRLPEDSGSGGSLDKGMYNGPGNVWQSWTTNANSAVNAIYGKSNTVQPESIQYPYFIQVATGAETEDNIINEIELNNPFSLLDYKFSEYELNNASWLRSAGQYNSKAIYPTVYELLLKIYNGTETKAGVSVKLSTETFTDYDFVLNTADETFMLPIKVKLASGKAVVGNGNQIGFTDGTNTSYGKRDVNYNLLGFGTEVGLGNRSTSVDFDANEGLGITTDPTKSGIELSDSGLYLYFYVGETVQNANLINAGRIEETLVKKVDIQQATIASFPSDRYIDLTLGANGSEYIAPANGWVYINKTVTASNQYLSITAGALATRAISAASNNPLMVYAPISKGRKFIINFSAGGTTNTFRFIYAEGEV